MIFAYIRVSVKDQNTDRQLYAIKEFGADKNIKIDRIFEEKVSDNAFSREVYQSMKLSLRSGDTLIIKELDRLGHDIEQIKNEWRDLQNIGVDMIIVDTQALNTANKTDLERTLISNILYELLTYMARKERVRIRDRQAEGIAIAKKKGKYKGRKPIQCDNFESIYKRWRDGKITSVKAIEETNLTKATFYRKAKLYENKQNREK